MFNSKKRVKDLSAPGAAAGAAGGVASTTAVSGGLPGIAPASAGNIQKLEMAKRLALKINAQKNLGAEAQVYQVDIDSLNLTFSFCHPSSLYSPGSNFIPCSLRTGRDAASHQRHPAWRAHCDTVRVSQDHRGAAGREDQRQTELHTGGEAGGGAASGRTGRDRQKI